MGNSNPKQKLRANITKVMQQEIRIQIKINAMQKQQERLVADMKLKSKDPEKIRVLLKRYIMQKRSMMKMYSTLEFISNYKDRLESMETFSNITDTMLDISDTLDDLQSSSDVSEIQHMMRQLNQNNMRNDVLQDTLMDSMLTEHDEEYETEIMQQILDEIGIDPSLLEGAINSRKIEMEHQQSKENISENEIEQLKDRFKALIAN